MARADAGKIPERAHAGRDGGDWACARGFAEIRNQCDEVRVPEQTHLDRSGDGCECDRPFVQSQTECVLR
ncbi:MAG TPA: hypothetical protein DIU07_10970 [Rhodobacteraceae bacterium]|nr:hypothetical protein [Paracoccaceae bacterium]